MSAQEPGKFNNSLVLEQVRYSGLFEAIQVRKSGYAYRHLHEDYFNRFSLLLSGDEAKQASLVANDGDYQQACTILVMNVR